MAGWQLLESLFFSPRGFGKTQTLSTLRSFIDRDEWEKETCGECQMRSIHYSSSNSGTDI